jgi:hypothetical protein
VHEVLEAAGMLYEPDWEEPAPVSPEERARLARRLGQAGPLSEMIIVSNASPLITLTRIERFGLLRDLFEHVHSQKECTNRSAWRERGFRIAKSCAHCAVRDTPRLVSFDLSPWGMV